MVLSVHSLHLGQQIRVLLRGRSSPETLTGQTDHFLLMTRARPLVLKVQKVLRARRDLRNHVLQMGRKVQLILLGRALHWDQSRR